MFSTNLKLTCVICEVAYYFCLLFGYNEGLRQMVRYNSKVLLKRNCQLISGRFLRITGNYFPLGMEAVILLIIGLCERIKR